MRVHLVGNTCNMNYGNAKFLRKIGVDAHLFFARDADSQQQPASEDPELLGALPEWCHGYSDVDVGSEPWTTPSPEFIRELAGCDLLHVHDIGLVWAAMTGRPFVWHPYGWDFYGLPFFDYVRAKRPDDPAALVPPCQMRWAMSQADAVILQWWFESWIRGYRLIDRFGLTRRVEHIPIVIDTEKFCPGPKKDLAELLEGRCSAVPPHDLVLFHPSRQMISRQWGVYFGNDILYRAVAKLKASGIRCLVVVVEKGNPDEAVAKELIRDPGIDDLVVWVAAMVRHRLIDWNRTADVTVASLAGGLFGGVCVEALACGGALMGNIATQSSDSTFWPPPTQPSFMNVGTEQEVVDWISRLNANRPALIEMGVAGRRWVEERVSGPVVAAELVALYERVLRDTPPPNRSQTAGLQRGVGMTGADTTGVLKSVFDVLDATPAARVTAAELDAACCELAYALTAERARSRRASRSLRSLAAQGWSEIVRRYPWLPQ